MSPERADQSEDSLYQDIEITLAARSGDIGRLNRLLARLAKTQTPAEKRRSSTPNSSPG